MNNISNKTYEIVIDVKSLTVWLQQSYKPLKKNLCETDVHWILNPSSLWTYFLTMKTIERLAPFLLSVSELTAFQISSKSMETGFGVGFSYYFSGIGIHQFVAESTSSCVENYFNPCGSNDTLQSEGRGQKGTIPKPFYFYDPFVICFYPFFHLERLIV